MKAVIQATTYHGVLTCLICLARNQNERGEKEKLQLLELLDCIGSCMRPATSHVRFSDAHSVRDSSDDQAYEEQSEAIPRSVIRRRCMAPDGIHASLDANKI